MATTDRPRIEEYHLPSDPFDPTGDPAYVMVDHATRKGYPFSSPVYTPDAMWHPEYLATYYGDRAYYDAAVSEGKLMQP